MSRGRVVVVTVSTLLALGCRAKETAPAAADGGSSAASGKLEISTEAGLTAMCEGTAATVTSAPPRNTQGRTAIIPLLRMPGEAHYQPWSDVMGGPLGDWMGTTQSAGLVVCMDAKDVTETVQCSVKGRTHALHAGQLSIAVFEARSGNKLAQSDVHHEDHGCPDREEKPRTGFHDLSMTIARATAPYQAADAKPFFDARALGHACSGEAVYGATPYDAAKGANNTFAVYMRESEYDAKDPSDAFIPIKDDVDFGSTDRSARNKSAF